MICVSTWSFYPWLRSKGSYWSRISRMLAAVKASIELVNKNYSRPTIYTDSLGKYIFSKLTDKADFINCYDDLYNNIPPSLWATAKIFTYAKQNTPFFHFDLDFLCFNKFNDQIFDCDILVQGYEDLKVQDRQQKILIYYNTPIVKDYYKLPNIFHVNDVNAIQSVNMGCVFFNNMDLHKTYIDTSLSIINENLTTFSKGPILNMCVIEQHTLGILIHNSKVKCNTLLETGWSVYPGNNDFFHFCGPYYKSHDNFKSTREKILSPWIDEKIMSVSEELLDIRKNFKLSNNIQINNSYV